jgi:hypothetical protein
VEIIKQELFTQQRGYLASCNILNKKLVKGEENIEEFEQIQ